MFAKIVLSAAVLAVAVNSHSWPYCFDYKGPLTGNYDPAKCNVGQRVMTAATVGGVAYAGNTPCGGQRWTSGPITNMYAATTSTNSGSLKTVGGKKVLQVYNVSEDPNNTTTLRVVWNHGHTGGVVELYAYCKNQTSDPNTLAQLEQYKIGTVGFDAGTGGTQCGNGFCGADFKLNLKNTTIGFGTNCTLAWFWSGNWWSCADVKLVNSTAVNNYAKALQAQQDQQKQQQSSAAQKTQASQAGGIAAGVLIGCAAVGGIAFFVARKKRGPSAGGQPETNAARL